MRKTWILAASLALAATTASAGGIDRSGQGLGALFEKGRYLEVSASQVAPNVKGADLAGGPTGDVTGDYLLASLSAKLNLNERLSLALVADQTYGADILYGQGSPLLGGTRVDVESHALMGLARYRLDDAFSVHGGLRLQRSSATVRLQGLAYGPVSGYEVRLGPDTATGLVAGIAYEVPQVALRVAATYHQAIERKLDTRETGPIGPLNGISTTSITTPRAVNLDFQTGIARDMLLFGQLRWVNWSEFRVEPARFLAVTGEGLIELKDTRTYTLGVARHFNDRWAGALSFNYEGRGDPLSSPLSPVNGRRGITIAAIYTQDAIKITAGISYIRLGDATLETGTPDTERAVMSGNKALGLGLKLGWTF